MGIFEHFDADKRSDFPSKQRKLDPKTMQSELKAYTNGIGEARRASIEFIKEIVSYANMDSCPSFLPLFSRRLKIRSIILISPILKASKDSFVL